MEEYRKKVDEAKGNVKKFAEESLKLKGEEQAKKIRAISDVLAVLRLKQTTLKKRFARSGRPRRPRPADRKSTRLNSSHCSISYAVFCLKKKK